jgi:hypothetical protein
VTQTVHVAAQDLSSTPPPDAKDLLLVVNPSGPNHVQESDETNGKDDNNVKSIPLQPNLAAKSLSWDTSTGGVNYAYTISGSDLPQGATGALYWSTETDFNKGQHSLIPNSVFTTATTAQSAPYTGHIDAATIGTPSTDANYKYLLFVINSDDAVTESDGPFSKDPNNVTAMPLPDIIMHSARAEDSRSVTLDYEIANTDLHQALDFNIYRTATDQFDITNQPVFVGTVTIPAAQTTLLSQGMHTDVQLALPGGIPIDPHHPFVQVVANPLCTILESDGDKPAVQSGATNNVSSFQKHAIAVVVHGYEIDGRFPSDWVNPMDTALYSLGYAVLPPLDWASDSRKANPTLIYTDAQRLADEIKSAAESYPSDQPVDLFVIGHSRGAVLSDIALQDLAEQTIPQLDAGYIRLDMIDPHPAVNYADHKLYSASPILGWLPELVLIDFQKKAQDPEPYFPANVNIGADYYQNTNYNQLPFPENVLNLWGEPSVAGAAVDVPWTGPGIGHTEIHEKYRNEVLESVSTQEAQTSALQTGAQSVETFVVKADATQSLSDVGLLYPAIVKDYSLAEWMVNDLSLAKTAWEQGDVRSMTAYVSSFYQVVRGQGGKLISQAATDFFSVMIQQLEGLTGLALTATQNLDGPVVHSVDRAGFHAQPTLLQVTFGQPLNPATVSNLANYRIAAPGTDGRFGTRDDRSVPIQSAVYDPTMSTVILTAARRLNLHRRYQLVVKGSTPSGVSDLAGNLLDGAGNGKPGSNYVVILRGFGVDKPGVPFRKLIREQLGGKPMSSRRVHLRTSSRASHQTHASPVHSKSQHSLRDERAAVPHGPLSSRRTRRGR